MPEYQVFAGKGRNRRPKSRRLTKAQANADLKRIKKAHTGDAAFWNPRIRKVSEGKRKKTKVIKQKPMKRQKTTAGGRAQDRARKAELPGRRISKTGRRYTERRSNRSDTKSRHY